MSKTVKVQNRGWEELAVPGVPNFIRRPEDDFPIPIAELSDTQLRRVAKAWTDELLRKARERRVKP